METMTCPNCQEQVEPIEDSRTPHYDRDAQAFTCAQAPNVVDPISGRTE